MININEIVKLLEENISMKIDNKGNLDIHVENLDGIIDNLIKEVASARLIKNDIAQSSKLFINPIDEKAQSVNLFNPIENKCKTVMDYLNNPEQETFNKMKESLQGDKVEDFINTLKILLKQTNNNQEIQLIKNWMVGLENKYSFTYSYFSNMFKEEQDTIIKVNEEKPDSKGKDKIFPLDDEERKKMIDKLNIFSDYLEFKTPKYFKRLKNISESDDPEIIYDDVLDIAKTIKDGFCDVERHKNLYDYIEQWIKIAENEKDKMKILLSSKDAIIVDGFLMDKVFEYFTQPKNKKIQNELIDRLSIYAKENSINRDEFSYNVFRIAIEIAKENGRNDIINNIESFLAFYRNGIMKLL